MGRERMGVVDRERRVWWVERGCVWRCRERRGGG